LFYIPIGSKHAVGSNDEKGQSPESQMRTTADSH
jgi:hypothetical protein